MRTTVLAAAALVAGLSTAAMAQSNDAAFNGLYFGGQVGYDSYKNDFGPFQLAGQGVEGGIFAGYNYRVNSMVLGLEGQLGLSNAKNKIDFGGDDITTKARESYGITARVGALVGDNTLAYVHGGWVNTRFKSKDFLEVNSQHLNGWKLGVGLETLVAQNVSLRAEYAYSDYEKKNDFEPKNSSFQVGVAYHF
ncbi:outer membrane protein [Govanella unica]|uniref:Porin family protein n=1 Tax=Govanella unica TaxID=2975056 RepID=A0A9X3TYE8_9PROT|nr:porin family protein [Govania unica]MDA5193824.1 porin family protein [Govania unica]